MKHLNKFKKFFHQVGLVYRCGLKRRFCDQSNRLIESKFSDGFSLHKPGSNFDNVNYVVTDNTKFLLQEHVKRTGGQVRTRFPPDPSGHLHIGHAKAININFNYAKDNDGICYLRYDDTNPESNDDTSIRGIEEMIQWLNFKPFKITYASDYFPQLYEMAEKIIEKDLAFVCHEPVGVNNETHSPWRHRNKSESLNAFREMKDGKYKEGEATLRLKFTTDQKVVDPVAYRIKHSYHPRTKDQWCIYPTYDFAQGLCDSLEDITHSFCSNEFSMRRSTYYWVCNAADVYCPVQIEYGRLNFLYTVTSKRKIATLIHKDIVQGWDDPRLYTLAALRRRGYPKESINQFCSVFGFRTASAYVDPIALHFYVRKQLDDTSTRIMAVFNPLKVVIANLQTPPDDPCPNQTEFEVPNVRANKSTDSHTVSFDKEIWIERSDFEEVGGKNFHRLTPSQCVGLKYTNSAIMVKEIVRKSCGKEIDYIIVKFVALKLLKMKKPRAFIHWVARPRVAEARMYENLFKSERPDNIEKVPGGFLSDINPNSKSVSNILLGETSIKTYQPYDRFQFERVGYFCVDPDSTNDKLVFNSTISLRQDKGFNS